MQAVMEFIKTHLVSLLAGVGAAAFIVIAVLGMSSKSVKEELDKQLQETKATQIRGMIASAKNDDVIQAEKNRSEKYAQIYEAAHADMLTINRREPLMPEVLPEPPTPVTAFAFREKYRDALRYLRTELVAGTLPTEQEIADEAQNVQELRDLEAEQAAAKGEAGPSTTRQPAAVNPGIRPISPIGGRPSPMTENKDELKYNATFRAQIAKANSIRVYVEEGKSFHRHPLVDQDIEPTAEAIWFAQLSLWVQQDFVDAIAKLNETAAEAAGSANAGVQSMIVKRIEDLKVLDYMAGESGVAVPSTSGIPGTRSAGPGGGGAGPRAYGSARPAGGGGGGSKGAVTASISGRANDATYDVVRTELTVVVDQRDVLKLVDAISKENFYQLIDMQYDAVDRAAARNEGYWYGTEPVVRVTMLWEGYFIREIYDPLMPASVRQQIDNPKR